MAAKLRLECQGKEAVLIGGEWRGWTASAPPGWNAGARRPQRFRCFPASAGPPYYALSVSDASNKHSEGILAAPAGHGAKTSEVSVEDSGGTRSSLRHWVLNMCLLVPADRLSENLVEKLVMESANVSEHKGQPVGQVRCR